MAAAAQTCRQPTPRRAFTLIEILIVLVVLLIGILALVRLFPGGFLTLQRTSELSNATALAEQQMDQERNLLTVQESVVPSLPDINGNYQVVTNILPDDLTDFTSANLPAGVPAGWDPYYLSNINRIRTVIGETFRVPVPTPNSATGAYGAAYMLQLGPVYNQFGTDPNGNPTDSINVHGVPMERIEQTIGTGVMVDEQDPNLALDNEAQYAIDYDDELIAFYPRVAASSATVGSRQFTIEYAYYAVNGGQVVLQTPVTGPSTAFIVPDVDPATLPPGTQPSPIWRPLFNLDGLHPNSLAPPPGYTPALGIKRESDDVSRKFRLITGTTVLPSNTAPVWDQDPYEYAWYSAQEADVSPQGIHVNVGVLVFNPIGHNEIVQTAAGPSPLTVRVDYTTFDNHILREDRGVPSGPPFDLRMSIPFILTNGDVLNDGTTYSGMFRNPGAATPDILIYNANTGEKIGSLTNGVLATGGDFIRFTVAPQAGTIRLNQTDVQADNLQGATLRIFYSAQKQWGMQVQKATTHYLASTSPTLTYNQYYVGGSDANGDGDPNRVYFPPCDAGKTVVLGVYYIRTDPNNPSVYQRITNEQFQIDSNPATFDTVGGQLLPYIDVSLAHPGSLGLTSLPTGEAVSSVEGISLKSRVVWEDVGRWRRVDTDTLLAPALPR